MELKAKHTHQLGVLMVALALVALAIAADEPHASAPEFQALPGCNYTCGDVKVPYPFGYGISSINQRPCYLEREFGLGCNNSKLYLGNMQVLHIDIEGQMDVLVEISSSCYKKDAREYYLTNSFLRVDSFSISSTENKFLTIGCDNFGYLNSVYNEESYSTGCLTECHGNRMIHNGTCSGIGCCQVDIPPGMRNISVQTSWLSNSTNQSWGNCSYSFVVKQGSYTFSKTDLQDMPYRELPLVMDWAVGNKSCNASESGSGYACRNNSYCDDEETDLGYRCKCNPGYEGNPYYLDGCTDIDECKTSNNTCIDENHCQNTNGNYTCFCPKGESGNGTLEGGCQQRNASTKLIIGVVAGVVAFMILLVVTALLYFIYRKRKLMKLKEKFFHENGGFILQQKLRTREDSSQTAKIFTEHELNKATNNYDESLIIGRGGYGIVYKGILPDQRIVAIKKSKIADKSQIEQFINEVVVMSQINHRNVVKLLGCCLETEVPLLVYEYVSNGTLHDLIHGGGKVEDLTWKTRLRIAAEAAGALSYLHSAASVPIIHRDVKGANILLDDTYTAKVSDFGASKLVPLDHTDIATIVQGTLGYLDPEYMQSQHLTEKSDVYSFGVVLVELLTGEKPVSFDRPEEKRSLAMHFLSCLKEDRMFEVVQDGILNEDNKQEIKEVVILAAKCLRLRGEERPSMKEVAMELEGLRLIEKHPWSNTEHNLEETHYLLQEASSNIHYERGDSSSLQNTGYDTSRDHVSPVALHGGR